MKWLKEEERRRRGDVFLNGVKVVEATKERETPSPGELHENSAKALAKFGLEPQTTLMKGYADLGLHAGEGKRGIDDLLARAMVRLHKLARKGRGAMPTYVEVLGAGVEELEKRGIKPAEKVIKRGGFRHDIYGRWLKKWAMERGFQVRFERTLGPKAFDFVYEDSDGQLHGMEICLSGGVKENTEALAKGASVGGIVAVIGLFEKKALLKSVEKAIKGDLFGEKVKCEFIGEYYPE